MNKPLLIMVLCIFLGACTTTSKNLVDGGNMLTFMQIATEISVKHEAVTADHNLSQTTAHNVVTAH